MINEDKCWCECKNGIYVNKIIFGLCEYDNSFPCSCENGKYLAIILDNSVIMRDEII